MAVDHRTVYPAKGDRRLESHKVFVDTITLDEAPLSVKDRWAARRQALAPLTVFQDFDSLDTARITRGVTLGLLKPKQINALEITPLKETNWTDEERNKLVRYQRQAGLFDDDDAREIATLRKIPYAFHYC